MYNMKMNDFLNMKEFFTWFELKKLKFLAEFSDDVKIGFWLHSFPIKGLVHF